MDRKYGTVSHVNLSVLTLAYFLKIANTAQIKGVWRFKTNLE